MEVLWGLSHSTIPDLGYWFAALLKTVPFASLTSLESDFDKHHELNSVGLPWFKCGRSPRATPAILSKNRCYSFPSSVSAFLCLKAVNDLGLLRGILEEKSRPTMLTYVTNTEMVVLQKAECTKSQWTGQIPDHFVLQYYFLYLYMY